MAEIVFRCQCGMILKVYGEDHVGQGIVCPSCGSTVVVPAVSIAVEALAPHVTDGAAKTTGNWFGLAYLAGVGIVTVGLIKFVLMPALASPVSVGRVELAQKNEPEYTTKDTEPDEAPVRRLKKPRGRTPRESAVAPSVPAAPDDETEKSDDSVTTSRTRRSWHFGLTPTAPPSGMGPGLSEVPTPPRPETGDIGGTPDEDEPPAPSKPSPRPEGLGSDIGGPAMARRLSKDDTKPTRAKKPAARKSDFEHIEDKEVREALEHAASNTTNYDATWIAERFLRRAEKLADGDTEVLAEIKKLPRQDRPGER